MSSVAPFIKPSYSEDKKTTALATSSGCPALANGIVFMVNSEEELDVWFRWKRVPNIKPGATAFIRIPCGPSSVAKERVHVNTAPFAAE